MKQFLIIGLGRFGRAVAEELADNGGQVIAVDTDMTLVDALRDRVAVAAQVDAVEPDVLKSLGADEVDAAVVAIGDDFAAQILAVAVLKEMDIETIVARASGDRERRILELAGATRIVTVEVETGQRVARSLLGRDVLDHFALGEGVSLVYWTADDRVVGKSLAECRLREDWNINLVAVRGAGQESLNVLPTPDHVFQAGDVLLLVGADARLSAFTK